MESLNLYVFFFQLNIFAFQFLICINFLQWCRLCNFLVILIQICIKFGANLASELKKIMQKQHFLIVLYGTNLVSHISTIFNAQLALFKCKKRKDLMHILVGLLIFISLFFVFCPCLFIFSVPQRPSKSFVLLL